MSEPEKKTVTISFVPDAGEITKDWEPITKEREREFQENSMARIGDVIEMYREKERRGLERARTRMIGYSPSLS